MGEEVLGVWLICPSTVSFAFWLFQTLTASWLKPTRRIQANSKCLGSKGFRWRLRNFKEPANCNDNQEDANQHHGPVRWLEARLWNTLNCSQLTLPHVDWLDVTICKQAAGQATPTRSHLPPSPITFLESTISCCRFQKGGASKDSKI